MNIAFIKPTESIEPTGGVKIQALMWKEGLEQLGHQVELIDFWKDYSWKQFDIIIIFQFGGMFRTMIREIVKINSNLVLAPIIDTNQTHTLFKFFTKYWGSQKYLGLTSRFHDLYLNRNLFKGFLVRSNYEASYISKCLEIDNKRIHQVPLSIRIKPINYFPEKENFCFHVSRLAAKNKNVERLIKAAIKYRFNLILAGNLNGDNERDWLNNIIKNQPNIKYVGRLHEDDLLDHYRRAKVFALPSIMEGVGMVALEAASYGCEIVLTDRGAPKDYYDGQAHLINPFDVNMIGTTIKKALENPTYQPKLQKYMQEKYSLLTCCKLLQISLEKVINIK